MNQSMFMTVEEDVSKEQPDGRMNQNIVRI